jgi:hypothetical protein
VTDVHRRPARPPIAPVTAVVVAAAVALGVVVLVWALRHQPRSVLPVPTSVSIGDTNPADGAVRLGRTDAARLAQLIGTLPKPFPEASCPAGSRAYVLRFATADGPITVTDDLDGCAGVTVTSPGVPWAARWEPDHQLRDMVHRLVCGIRPAARLCSFR